MRRAAAVILAILFIGCASGAGEQTVDVLRERAHAITGDTDDYDALMAAIGGAHLVLLGEATHGTHEFYRERSRLTQRLITEKGLTSLGLEADWSDALRIDRYVRGISTDRSAEEALGGFDRFPRWMWRNREFADLVEWIRQHNAAVVDEKRKVRIFGLDLYGADESLAEVTRHLREVDPALAASTRRSYDCFDRYRGNFESYGTAAARSRRRSCESQAVDVLESIRSRMTVSPPQDRRLLEALFFAEQNARVVRNAESYYREGAVGKVSTWNLRDHHMVQSIDAIQRFLLRLNRRDGMIVWAHNSHVGDARATDRAREGELNLGQLVREHWQRAASFTVGFTTHRGEVIAATNWGGKPQRKTLRTSIPRSHGALLHSLGMPAFYILLRDVDHEAVTKPLQQRAVGVIYRPETELASHYFAATLREQFDAVIHIDVTAGLSPLDPL